MKRIVIVIIVFAAIISNLFGAEEVDVAKYGIFGEYGPNTHSADFYKLTGIPNCCPHFESGSGSGFGLGIMYELPLFAQFDFVARLSYQSFNGEMEKVETTSIIIDDAISSGQFLHTMKGNFSDIGFEPLIQWNPFEALNLFVGLRASLALVKSYSQKEQITEPQGSGTFMSIDGSDSHSRIRNESSGDIPNAESLLLFGIAGASYDLPLNKRQTMLLSPQINYYMPINSRVGDLDWKVEGLRGGLALKFAPREIKYLEEEELKIDTIFKETDNIASLGYKIGKSEIEKYSETNDDANILITKIIRTDTIYIERKYDLSIDGNISGIDENGLEIPNPVFVIEEEEENIIQPLLPYIFFEENSSLIQNRYQKLSTNETKSFTFKGMDTLTKLETYNRILNIIGKRMIDYPNAKLRITGCNSDFGSEKNNKSLSESRAKEVFNYLSEVWAINDDRMTVEVRNLPAKPSTPLDDQVKIEENQRVELFSETWEIIAPIFINDTNRKINPPIARFRPRILSEAGTANWKVRAWQQSSRAYGNLDSTLNQVYDYIDWKIQSDQKSIPRNNENINYLFTIQDLRGNEAISAIKEAKIDYISIFIKRLEKIKDRITDKYTLILFDFDDFSIKGANKRIIDLIKSKLSPKSTVRIEGFTDLTGDDEHNKMLAQKRAEETNKLLRHPNSVLIGGRAIGDNNNLPEGRFYCRTVDVIVETPVE